MAAAHSTPPRRRRLQNYLLVWVNDKFDASSSDCQHSLQQLRAVVNDVTAFTDVDACLRFLESVQHEKVFVIVSDVLAPDLIPQIHSMVQVDTIYIWAGDQPPSKPWCDQWSKIKHDYTRIEPICMALQQSTKQCDRDSTPMSFVGLTTSGSTPNLNELEPSFMYTQLLKNALLDMVHEPQALQDLVKYCRETKAESPSDLKAIEEFERTYRADKAIWWYTRECFTYQMLNRALRLLEADIIVNMGFFVHDLHRQIEQWHQLQVSQYGGEAFKLYRGQGLSMADFDKLKSTQGGLLSFNSFVSTSKHRDIAQFVADSSASAIDKVGVVFVMTIDPGLTSTAFADIGQLSYFADEAEVLFSMHSVFRIDQVTDLGNSGRLWEVAITLTTDDDPQLRLLAETMDEDIKTFTGWERLGQLLMSVGEVEKAEELYITLLKQASSDSDRANHNHHLGWVKDAQGDYKEALSYYEKALDMMQKTLPANPSRFAITYEGIGTVYSQMGEYLKALSHYEKALHMRQETLPANHCSFTTTYSNIGSVYSNMGAYERALSYHGEALHIRQANSSSQSP